jgi:hypothetical protein
MNVPEIREVKDLLATLKSKGLVSEWELPYENLLTRRSAAIFFVTPADEGKSIQIWNALEGFKDFSVRTNTERKLSQLRYRITFSAEEKEKNQKSASSVQA